MYISPFVCIYIHGHNHTFFSAFSRTSAALYVLPHTPQVSSFLWKLTTYSSSLFSTSEIFSKPQPLSDPLTIVTGFLCLPFMEAGPGQSYLNYAQKMHRVLLDAYPQISCSDTRHLWLMAHFLFKFNSVTAQSYFVPWKRGWKLFLPQVSWGQKRKTKCQRPFLCSASKPARLSRSTATGHLPHTAAATLGALKPK